MAEENENENENGNVVETDGTQAEVETVEPTAEAEVGNGGETAEEASQELSVAETGGNGGETAEEASQEAAPEAGGETPEEASQPAAKAKKKRLPRSERSQRTKKKREKAAERKPITRLPKPEHERGRRQERQGTVVAAAADKTIVVRVDVVKAHPTYKKVIKRSTKFHAHDERNEAKPGDVVRIVETRPLSKMKRWRLQEIVEAAK